MILSLFTITTILGRWIEHDQRSKQITEPKKTLAEENCLKKSQETELKPTLIHARKSSIGLEVPESKLLITLDLDLKTTELKCWTLRTSTLGKDWSHSSFNSWETGNA